MAGRDATELAADLTRHLTNMPAQPMGAPAPPVYAFSGQGGAVTGMARKVYTQYATARAVLNECEEIYRQLADASLLEVLVHGEGGTAVTTAVSQPAQFAYQIALARQWRAFGAAPSCLVGHSLGEIAAWCEAGAMPLPDALGFVIARGRLMDAGSPPGRMLAVSAAEQAVRRLCAALAVDVAAVNGPCSVVLSGAPDAVAEAHRALGAEGFACRVLPMARAFHSRLMDPVLPGLREAAEAIHFTPMSVACADAGRGDILPVGTVLTPDHLVRHARDAVLFDAALAAVGAQGHTTFVDIGPSHVLGPMIEAALPDAWWTAGTASKAHEGYPLDAAVAALHLRGVQLDWSAMAAGGRRVALPAAPFHRTRFPAPPLPGPPPQGARPASASPPPPPDGVTASSSGPVVLARSQLAAMGEVFGRTHHLMTQQLRMLSRLSGSTDSARSR